MGDQNKIQDLISRRAYIEQGGRKEGADTLQINGKLTARQRIDQLLDTGSFVESGAFIKQRGTNFNLGDKEAPADGVVTGYGVINGRLVYVYSQDASVLGGALGEMHGKKITDLYTMAMKMGAPIIALIDSAGLRLQEATDALAGFGNIYLKQSLASGVIPQITAILGSCGGGTSIMPSLSDFTFMTTKESRLFVNSPNALDSKLASFESFASAEFHSKESGLVDFVCENDESCMAEIRNLVNYLPSNNLDDSPLIETNDDLNRASEALNNSLDQGVDARLVVSEIADDHKIIEISAAYTREIMTAFIRLNGSTVGVIAHNTVEYEPVLTSNGCEKIASYVKKCDAFNIPIITMIDVTGFKATVEEEKNAISKAVAKMTYEFANATVPKVSVILNRAYGSAYVASNSKHIGADFVYAWPEARISVMEAESAVRIMYAKEIEGSDNANALINEKVREYNDMQGSPYAAAARGYIDDIIEPAATRKRLIVALEMLFTKREFGPEKKHGTI